MKVEKINESQIRIIMSTEDLKDKNIDIDELIYGEPKSKILFNQVISEAADEVDFRIEHGSLISANVVNISSKDVEIILTVIGQTESEDSIFNMVEKIYQMTAMASRTLPTKTETTSKTTSKKKSNNKATNKASYNLIYRFIDFDTLMQAVSIIKKIKVTFKDSILYKDGKSYILLLMKQTNVNNNKLDLMLSEFGDRLENNSVNYLSEHGDVFIKNNALKILIEYFN